MLLMDCRMVYFDLVGLLALRMASVYALMYPSHYCRILQPWDDRKYLALDGEGRIHMRAWLSAIPVGAVLAS